MNLRNVECLIDLIKPNNCLYDTSHNDNKNIQLKESIWTKIAQSMDKDVKTIKIEWKKIRNCHRDAVKRQKLLSYVEGPDYKPIKKWKYEHQMQFLLNFMTTRRREPYFVQEHEQDEDESVASEPICEPVPSSNDNYKSKPDNSLSRPILPKKSDKNNASKSVEPLDLFFEAMCATTKRLPIKYQMHIKKEIFQIVSQIEEVSMMEGYDS